MFRCETVLEGQALPEASGVFYQYVLGKNGLFLHANRTGLEVRLPLACPAQPLPGLAEITPLFRFRRIPAAFLCRMQAEANLRQPFEALFYLSYLAGWRCVMPAQIARRTSVRPLDPLEKSYQEALVEVHSHPPGAPVRFSRMDDAAEGAFRIYVVFGDVFPHVACRLGVYGRFFPLPLQAVFAPGEVS